LDAIDRTIEKMQAEAAGPCIDALIEWTDRDAYREAMRRAYGLKAVRALRERLAGEVEESAVPDPRPVRTKQTKRS
jgi:hypothetical protein